MSDYRPVPLRCRSMNSTSPCFAGAKRRQSSVSNQVLIPSPQTKKEPHKVKLFSLAENEGFEPPLSMLVKSRYPQEE